MLAKAKSTWSQGASTLRELRDTRELERKAEAMRKACAKAGIPPFDGEIAAASSGGDSPT